MTHNTGTPIHPTTETEPVFDCPKISRFHDGWKTENPDHGTHPVGDTTASAPPADWPWLVGIDLTDQEFLWLKTSGEIHEAAPGLAFTANENPGPAARAAAIKCVAPYTGVIAKMTAAWVWGYGPVTLPKIYLAGGHRSKTTATARYIRSTIPENHRHQLGPCEVTTPARTALDLARFDTSSAADQAINHLLAHHTSYQEILELACNHLPERLPQKALTRIRTFSALHDPTTPAPSTKRPAFLTY